MPSPISAREVASIEGLLELGFTVSEIAREVSCSITTIYKIRRNIRTFNSSKAPYSHIGRPKKLNNAMEEAIKKFFADNKTTYLDEAVRYIQREFDQVVSRYIVSRVLKQANITHKQASNLLRGFKCLISNSYTFN